MSVSSLCDKLVIVIMEKCSFIGLLLASLALSISTLTYPNLIPTASLTDIFESAQKYFNHPLLTSQNLQLMQSNDLLHLFNLNKNWLISDGDT